MHAEDRNAYLRRHAGKKSVGVCACVKASAEFHSACFEGFVFKAPSPFFDSWMWILHYDLLATTTALQQQQTCVSGRVFNTSPSSRRR